VYKYNYSGERGIGGLLTGNSALKDSQPFKLKLAAHA